MWLDYIKSISDNFEFAAPAQEQAIQKAESELGQLLPNDLRELLSETNGVYDRSSFLWFILPIERIEEDNHFMRQSQVFNSYMPFDDLLIFADAGTGDKFGFPISRDRKIGKDVYAWDHDNDSRSWCAPSLQIFIKWWHEGQLKW